MILFSLILVDQAGDHSKLDIMSAGKGKIRYQFVNNKGKKVSPKSIGAGTLIYTRKESESNVSLKNRLVKKIQLAEKSLYKVAQGYTQGSIF